MSEKQDRVYPRTASDVDRRISGVSFAELMGITRDLQTHYVELEESVHEVKEIATTLTEWKISIEDDISSIASIEAKTQNNEANITLLTEWKGSVEGEVASIASIEQRVSAAESTIEILTKYGDGETDSIAALVTRVTGVEAEIELVVENGNVKGGVLIEAINGETAAKIDADRLDIEGKTLNIKVEATNIEGLLTADKVLAEDLKVTDANFTGTLSADKIDVKNLKVDDANFEGTLTASKIDVDGVFEAMKGDFDLLVAGIVTADFVEALAIDVSKANITGLLSANNIDVDGVILAGSARIKSIVADEISTTEITADLANVMGTLQASYIDCPGVINVAKADIIELVASKVNASYIEGFELNFTHGKIGGFEIIGNSLRTDEDHTLTAAYGAEPGVYIGTDGMSLGKYYLDGAYKPTFTATREGVVRGTNITAFDTKGKTELSLKDGRFRITPDIRFLTDFISCLPLMQINYGGVSKCLVAMLPDDGNISGQWTLAIYDSDFVDSHYFE